MLNLSPSEAARRSDEAKRKLSDGGIDPATLSQEQFDIFANQSPELQHESLAMLVKYGAERLRIVHPNKDDGASASPAAENGDKSESSKKKKKKRPSTRTSANPDVPPKVKKTRGACQACKAKKLKCGKAKPECAECAEAGIECYYPPQETRKPKSDARAEDEPDQTVEPDAAEHAPEPPADIPAVVHDLPDLSMSQPEPEPIAEEDNSDLGSPGFNSSQHVDAPTFPEVSHDLYQPSASGLTYPSAVPDDIGAGMDYAAYSNQIGHQQAAQSGMAYPQQSQQTSNATYHDSLSAPPPPPPPAPEPEPDPDPDPDPDPEPEPVRPVQAPAQPAPSITPHIGNRRSLPSGSAPNVNGYSNTSNTGNGTAWQTANVPASTSPVYAAPASPRQSRTGRKAAPAAARVYDNSQNEALAAAATLSQAALRKTQPSPATRTVSPFQNPTQAAAQAARAKSKQGQRSQSRATASPFQQASSTQPAAVDTASIYHSAGSAEATTNSNYDQQYPRYNTATTQSGQMSSRGAYDAYSQQQTNTSSSSTSYAGYDSYNARSQASTSTPLAAPAAHAVPASYTKKAAPANSGWSNNSTSHRSNNSYGSNTAVASTNSGYNMPAASTQQQSASMQSFNVRPQPAAQPSRTNTPASYNAPQQPAQQSRQQQQQAYSSYSSQPHSSSTQPPSQAQQQQQDWYGFGSSTSTTPGYGSGSRGAGYSQSTQQRPAAMNISGSTYQSMHDQEVYDMFRHPPAH